MSYFQQFRLDSNRFLKTTFCDKERGVFFESSKWVHGILETLRTSSNKVGFFLKILGSLVDMTTKPENRLL
jgi:hypothetical protein